MQTFLQKLAEYIHLHYKDRTSELCIVLPNRRAKLFLKNHLSLAFQKPLWAPQIFSIEDFISELSGAEILDSLSSVFEFYAVYAAIEKDKAQSVDDFLQWAPTLLNDFNEIDQYLVDAPALFNYLSDDRALSVWNADGKEISDFQKKYLIFWKSLSVYYQKFTENVESKNKAYPGLAYKKVADNSLELVKQKKWHKVIFAGFNALNAAEMKIFRTLADANLADILWDADGYYLDDENQEAGKFIRNFKNNLGKFNKVGSFLWQEDFLLNSKKKITIAGVAKQVGQAKLAGEILNELAKEGMNNFKNHALVLADENLLIPVMHAIPANVDRFNVTMGYSLNNLAINSWIDTLFSLQENSVKYGRSSALDKVRFYYRDLKKLVLHPYFEILAGAKKYKEKEQEDIARGFIHFLDKENRVFVKFSQIESYFKAKEFINFDFLEPLFMPWQNNVQLALNSFLTSIDNLKGQLNLGVQKMASFEQEVLFHYSKIVKRILSLVQETAIESFKEIKTIRIIFNQLVKSQSIAFIGEPLEGLQIMGMLETRTLDFDTVILLSANEGILPAGKKENSFIPFELKSKFGLPTYSDKDAIFAYHFYRLLQHAKKVYLIFNTETDEFGSGERSRYIAQLQQEMSTKNKLISIEERLYTMAIDAQSGSSKIDLVKDAFVQNRLEELRLSGFSPSLLNTYRKCTLQFYFKHIARLKENEEPEESIDSATFGTVIHAIVEEAYTQFIGKTIEANALKNALNDLKTKVETAFKKEYGSGELEHGKNYLNLKIAEKYLLNFLNEELSLIQQLKIESKTIQIIELESELNYNLNFNNSPLLLKGKIDRIDKIGDSIRIIDYKTGRVEAGEELNLKEILSLRSNKKNKSFQLLMYAYLFRKAYPQNENKITSGILSFRKPKAGFMPVKISKNEMLNEAALLEFEQELNLLLQEIFNLENTFSQTEDLKICEHCPYVSICNR